MDDGANHVDDAAIETAILAQLRHGAKAYDRLAAAVATELGASADAIAVVAQRLVGDGTVRAREVCELWSEAS